jgi:hypothetical protein
MWVIGSRTGAIPQLLEATRGGVTIGTPKELTDALRTAATRTDHDPHAVAKIARDLLAIDRLAQDLDRAYEEFR